MINYSDEKYITDAVNKFSDTVFRVAYQYTGNRADAEDILQDVFLKLLGAFQTGDDNRLKAWLIRVTINRSKDFLRAKKRRRETLLNDYAQLNRMANTAKYLRLSVSCPNATATHCTFIITRVTRQRRSRK